MSTGVPSLWMGEAGILLVAHTLSPAAWQEMRLLEAVRANVENPTWELMWGSPGTMLAAQVMYERTGGEQWLDAWNASADRLWEEWRDDLWCQDLYGSRLHVLGPAHGFAGNVLVLSRGDLLDPARRAELERRTVAALAKYAVRGDGFAQWPPTLEPARGHDASSGAMALRASSPRSQLSRRPTTSSATSFARAES